MSIEFSDLKKGVFFEYQKSIYQVQKTAQNFEKFTIYTDKRTFIPADIRKFLEEIKICSNKISIDAKKPTDAKNGIVHQAEIIEMNGRANRISAKLEDAFNAVYSAPNEENVKKAETMVKLSNAIVANEMARYKILNS